MTSTSDKHYPNLIIAGAPKSGTSSLFFWLGAHPEVCASKIKETYFLADEVIRFNENLNVHEHGLETYGRFFQHCKAEKYRAEATPVYIYHRLPLKLIPQLPQVPKVIFILRKPADRLYSHWRFNRYRMKNIKLSFEEYLDFNNAPSGWANYLEQTRYINYIKKWMEVVGKENVLVYQFEKMISNQQVFMEQVARDLGIDPEFYASFDFFHRNETVAIGSKKLHRIGLRIEPLVPQWLQEKIIPLYLKLNARKAPPITEQERELKNAVGRKYQAANQELAKHFPHLDLDLWA